MNPTTFFITQKSQRFEQALSSWVNQVRSARSFEQALRISTQPPSADPLVRSLGTTRQSLNRAKTQVEQHLTKTLPEVDEATRARLYRMACGHWPKIAQTLA